jgi:drug/metabolite transporter (DMT)-like permease
MVSKGERAQGVVAAVLAPLFMTVGLHIWSIHWKGSAFALNLFKCSVASLMFITVSWALIASSDDERDTTHLGRDVGYILLSSVFGIVIGDNTWLQALLIIGPARVIVVDALKPGLAALFGYLFLGERVGWMTGVGIALSTVGVYLVCMHSGSVGGLDENKEKKEEGERYIDSGSSGSGGSSSGDLEDVGTAAAAAAATAATNAAATRMFKGYILAFMNILLDVVGSVLTKRFGATFNTFEINALRFGFAAVCMGVQSVYHSTSTATATASAPSSKVVPIEKDEEAEEEVGGLVLKQHYSSNTTTTSSSGGSGSGNTDGGDEDKGEVHELDWYRMPTDPTLMPRHSWGLATLGVCLVTFMCPALSQYALFKVTVGVCITLTSIGPLYSLPIDAYVQQVPVRPVAIMGSVFAIAGVALLSLV